MNYRVSVDGTSLCSFGEFEEQAINLCPARVFGLPVLVVQLRPAYRLDHGDRAQLIRGAK